MTDWLDLVLDARPVRAVFGDVTPSLSNVLVESMTLEIRGRGVSLAIALDDYPAEPPRKWRAAGNDVVWLTLAFDDADLIEVHGPLTTERADLVISRDGDHVVGELTGTTHTIRVRSRWFSIRKMTAGQTREHDVQG
jgi:hypothetical protein